MNQERKFNIKPVAVEGWVDGYKTTGISRTLFIPKPNFFIAETIKVE